MSGSVNVIESCLIGLLTFCVFVWVSVEVERVGRGRRRGGKRERK